MWGHYPQIQKHIKGFFFLQLGVCAKLCWHDHHRFLCEEMNNWTPFLWNRQWLILYDLKGCEMGGQDRKEGCSGMNGRDIFLREKLLSLLGTVFARSLLGLACCHWGLGSEGTTSEGCSLGSLSINPSAILSILWPLSLRHLFRFEMTLLMYLLICLLSKSPHNSTDKSPALFGIISQNLAHSGHFINGQWRNNRIFGVHLGFIYLLFFP